MSSIEWTNETWNPAQGCSKVSDGCKNCYMMRDLNGRFGKDVIGTVHRSSDNTFFKPLKWQRKCEKEGTYTKVFLGSYMDLFHMQIDSYRNEIWQIIRNCPNLIFQVLTKRPERINRETLPIFWDEIKNRVWLGVSCENQEQFNHRTSHLCGNMQLMGTTLFASLEPLLELIVLENILKHTLLDWIIVGGESGNITGKYTFRECESEWLIRIVRECKTFETPVFVKQLGTHISQRFNLKDRHGRDSSEWPIAQIKVREFPQTNKSIIK